MSSFFGFLSTFLWCGTSLGLATIVALSLPESRLRTVMNEVLSWGAVALCALYVVTPVDLIPEAVIGPLGYIDDLAAIYLGWQKFKDGLQLRQLRRDEDGLE